MAVCGSVPMPAGTQAQAAGCDAACAAPGHLEQPAHPTGWHATAASRLLPSKTDKQGERAEQA